jgi:four helix bundle protein
VACTVLYVGVMPVRHFNQFYAWQLADAFKCEVYRIVRASKEAMRDFKFRDQILESARAVSKDIAEGFLRKKPRSFANYLEYALGSLVEAERRLIDGAQLGYYHVEDCQSALKLFAVFVAV